MSATRPNRAAKISARTKARRTRAFNKAVDAVLVAHALQIPGAVTKGKRFTAGPVEIAKSRIIVRAVLASIGHSAASVCR
jgi:hypothetical protein